MLSDWVLSVEMAQVSKVPVSRLIKQGEDDDGPTKKSRDEYRKAKELEEARYDNTFYFFWGWGWRRRTVYIWMRSCRVVRASDSQCRSRNCPGFDPSILRHSGIWGAADEAVWNIVHKQERNDPPLNIWIRQAESDFKIVFRKTFKCLFRTNTSPWLWIRITFLRIRITLFT